MNRKQLTVLAGVATTAGLGLAGAALYRATHPAGARGLDQTAPSRPVDPERYNLPPKIRSHDLPTPDGGTIHAIEAGAGRPLVLIHGITLRSDVWAPQFHQLTDQFRVIAVDLRGHGASTAGSAGYGLDRLGDDLATLLETLDLHDAIVVGHSMGGMTVMEFCGAHPEVLAERVAGLVFVATRAHQVLPPFVDDLARRLVEHGQHRLDGGAMLPARATVTSRLARLAFGDDPSPTAVDLVAEMGQSMDPDALIGSLSGLLDLDARVAIAATETPSMVIVGTRDLLTPVPAGRHLAHLLPDADLVVLPRCGHQVMQERPDELAELLRGFDRTLAGAASSLSRAVDDDPSPVTSDQVEHSEIAGGAPG